MTIYIHVSVDWDPLSLWTSYPCTRPWPPQLTHLRCVLNLSNQVRCYFVIATVKGSLSRHAQPHRNLMRASTAININIIPSITTYLSFYPCFPIPFLISIDIWSMRMTRITDKCFDYLVFVFFCNFFHLHVLIHHWTYIM